MGKGKGSGSLMNDKVGGCSRAAKKRRKQKKKAADTTSTSAKAPGPPLAPVTVQGKRDVIPPPLPGTTVEQPSEKIKNSVESGESNSKPSRNGACGTSAQSLTSAASSEKRKKPLTKASGHGITEMSLSRDSIVSIKREGTTESQALEPIIVDASEGDERSQMLLELDAAGVLSDSDVESGLKARQLLQWIVAPLPVEEFYESCWEQNVLVVRGRRPDYFKGWLETSDLESFISTQSMQYGVDLDVTNYINKRRVTLNPAPSGKGGEGIKQQHPLVTSRFVWEKFRQGCSLRMPCPQKYSDPLHRLLSALEEEFGCMVGSNVYLTPPRSQGFAPHWDDIEAFLLQVEGKKRWRVYPPANDAAALPRLSSPNLTDEQAGEPSLEVVLAPGDLLYFPRGWIHQAETVGDEPSLHITLSAMQANSWADLVEELVPQAVASAIETNKGMRSGLPRNYLEYTGVVHSDEVGDQRRERFKEQLRKNLGVVVEEALSLLDAAADQMGKRYISDRLPPVLDENEEAFSVAGRGDQPITPITRLRTARRGVARLILEDGMAVVYHCMDNSRVHHGNALSPLQFEVDDAPAIEVLLAAYPDPVMVYDLPHPPTEDLEDKVGIATSLYKEGFLLVVEDEEDDDEGDAAKKHGGVGEEEEMGDGF